MTIKQLGGVFGRNPTFNNVTIDGELIINGSVFTGLDYEGAWNADTNTPTLTSSVGTLGQFYIVSVAGATDLNGTTNWDVGDWALFNGSVWQRVEGGANGNFSTLSVSGLSSLNGGVNVTGNATFGDNGKAIFGAGSDLQIYHVADSASYISEQGSGSLIIQGNGGDISLFDTANSAYMVRANTGSDVQISHAGSLKLATTATGIDVTGSVTADGAVNSTYFIGGSSSVAGRQLTLSCEANGGQDNATHRLTVPSGYGSFNINVGGSERMLIDSSGNVGIGTSDPQSPMHLYTSSAINVADTMLKLTNVANTARYVGFQAQRDNSSGQGLNILITKTDATVVNALTIDTAANVGIGTGAPITISSAGPTLEVSGTAGGTLVLTDSNATSGARSKYLLSQGGALYFGDSADNGSSPSNNLVIDASGNVLVGTTSTPNGTSSYGTGFIPGDDARTQLHMATNSTSDLFHVRFYNPNGAVGDIRTSGTATAYNTSSDQRLKENITDANDAGDKIDAIQVRQYDWKADGSHQDYGMVAQELLEVAPEAVSQGETKEEMMAVDYSKLVPMMLKEIQSLRARIAALES